MKVITLYRVTFPVFNLMLENRCPVKYKCLKVVGSVRTQGEKKHVMAFKITAVSCKAEWDAHLLQVTRTFL